MVLFVKQHPALKCPILWSRLYPVVLYLCCLCLDGGGGCTSPSDCSISRVFRCLRAAPLSKRSAGPAQLCKFPSSRIWPRLRGRRDKPRPRGTSCRTKSPAATPRGVASKNLPRFVQFNSILCQISQTANHILRFGQITITILLKSSKSF